MIDLAILLLINSALCFGFYNAAYYVPSKSNLQAGSATDYIEENEDVKGALWFIDKWAKDKWFYKPLVGCPPCMASFHSIYPYWLVMYVTNNLSLTALAFYPIYILALSGINYLIDKR